jgi:hypothetical protein
MGRLGGAADEGNEVPARVGLNGSSTILGRESCLQHGEDMREIPQIDVGKAPDVARSTTRIEDDAPGVDRPVDHTETVRADRTDTLGPELARLASRARILEGLVSGDARVLVADLVAGLEALAGSSADVVSLAGRRPTR